MTTATVPCNGCTLCCHAEALMLFPEHGDDVASYETEKWTIPGTNESGHILKHRADGACIYLGEGGCTIYERRPAVCRKFDCRLWFQQHTRADRRQLIKSGGEHAGAIFARGRELLPTLEVA